jgi:hypothetical protein
LNSAFKKKAVMQWLEFPLPPINRKVQVSIIFPNSLFLPQTRGMEKKKKKAPKQLLQASSVKYPEHWATRLESHFRAQRQGEFMGNSIITHIISSFFKM